MKIIKLEKKCCSCGEIKPRTEFYKRKKNNYIFSVCKKCNYKRTKDFNKDHQKLKQSTLKRIKENENYLWTTYKAECCFCGYNISKTPLCFHHLEPDKKKNQTDIVSSWIRILSLNKFKERILNTKFVVLCANCHFRLHKGEINL
jgi:hypothetical protein